MTALPSSSQSTPTATAPASWAPSAPVATPAALVRTSEQRVPPPASCNGGRPIDATLAVVARELPGTDAESVELLLGCVLANALAPKDWVWPLTVAPPSSGKNTLTEPLEGLTVPTVNAAASLVDSLSEKTLLSGLAEEGGKHSALKDASGRDRDVFWVIKDASTMTENGKDAKGSLMAQLRCVYDGSYSRKWGSAKQHEEWRGNALLVMSGTPSGVDRSDALAADLGSRFLKIRLPEPDERALVRAALRRAANPDDIRAALAAAYRETLNAASRRLAAVTLDADADERLIGLAIFASHARARRADDRERPMRLAIILQKVAKALAALRGLPKPDAGVFATLERLALDQISTTARRRVFVALLDGGTKTAAELSPSKAVYQVLEAMEHAGLVVRDGSDDETGGRPAARWRVPNAIRGHLRPPRST